MDGSENHRFRGTAENAKTKMCLRWEAGNCRFGERCNFAHGEHELRRLPPRSGMNRGYSRTDGPLGAGGPPGGAYFGGAPGAYGGGGGRAGGGGPYNGGFGAGQYGGGYSGNQAQFGGPMGGSGAGGGGMGYSAGVGGGGAGGYGLPQQQQQQPQHAGDQWGGGGGGYADPGGAVQGVSGWVQYTAPDGQKYYHHVPSDTTQWEVPEGWMPLQ